MLTKREIEQLKQLRNAGHRGVFAGDLLDKPTTRNLVARGLVDNTGGAPSSLGTIYINQSGRDELDELIEEAVDDEAVRQILATSDVDALTGNWPPLVKSRMEPER